MFDRDGALVLLDTTVGDGETKTGSRTDFFGGKKRIRNALFQPRRYPWAGLTKTNGYAVRLPRARNGNALAFRNGYGITRIDQQIDENLARAGWRCLSRLPLLLSAGLHDLS